MKESKQDRISAARTICPNLGGAVRFPDARSQVVAQAKLTALIRQTGHPSVIQRQIGLYGNVGDIVITMYGEVWRIVAVNPETYTIEYAGTRARMITRQNVSPDDERYRLAGAETSSSAQSDSETSSSDHSDLSEAYQSDDISEPSSGESDDIYRPTTGETIHTKIHTPHSAEHRSAIAICDMRAGRELTYPQPFLTQIGSGMFEFSPTTWRKDFGVYPVTRNEDEEARQREGNAKTYRQLAALVEADRKRIGATESQLKECLNAILRSNTGVSLEDMRALYPFLDEETLAHLSELAAILRLDQARAHQARGVIDAEVFQKGASFTATFGSGTSAAPAYRGARSATVHKGQGGVQSLRQADDTEFASTESPTRYRIDTLTDEELISFIDKAVDQKATWAINLSRMAEEGGSAVALEYLRQTTSRISVMPNGRIFIHLRGG